MVTPATDLEFDGRDASHDSNRQVLRRATRALHDRAEQSWAEVPETPAGLTGFLGAMYGLHSACGLIAAGRSGRAGEIERERSRIAALEQDLGADLPVPIPPHAPVPDGRDAAWGALYALNGSALGATVLLRIDGGASTSSAYLRLMKDYARSGDLAAFFRALNTEELDLTAAASGACAVFEFMARLGDPQR